MLKRRLIPVLFLKHGYVVRSEGFVEHKILGDPVSQVERYNAWDVDELIYIDISSDGRHDRIRDDAGLENPGTLEDIIPMIAGRCFMPLTFGGRIRNLDEAARRLNLGADKITLNSQALKDPEFVTAASRAFGSQAVVISIDVKTDDAGRRDVWAGGRSPTGWDPTDWAREVESRGAGEILVNSIDRDGRAGGYDLALIRDLADAVSIPVIACGGAGDPSHFVAGLEAGADAVAAGNLFHFKEMSYLIAKRDLARHGMDVRPPSPPKRRTGT